MDMSAFRRHLKNVEDKLNHPQASAMYEEKKSSKSLESTIRGVASGQLNEAHKLTAGRYGKGVVNKESAAVAEAEEVLGSYLNDYFGGAISEDTSEDDIMEAITNLFEMETVVVEYLENDNADDAVLQVVDSYLNEYFEGTISEDTSDEELSEAIADLLVTAEDVRLALDEGILGKIGAGAAKVGKALVGPKARNIYKKTAKVAADTVGSAARGAGDAVRTGYQGARRETGI
tara:strand:+ start:368 stop:1063 length:696 start_codon:yes stop_codon:yes gene_type:complete